MEETGTQDMRSRRTCAASPDDDDGPQARRLTTQRGSSDRFPTGGRNRAHFEAKLWHYFNENWRLFRSGGKVLPKTPWLSPSKEVQLLRSTWAIQLRFTSTRARNKAYKIIIMQTSNGGSGAKSARCRCGAERRGASTLWTQLLRRHPKCKQQQQRQQHKVP